MTDTKHTPASESAAQGCCGGSGAKAKASAAADVRTPPAPAPKPKDAASVKSGGSCCGGASDDAAKAPKHDGHS